MLLALSAVLSSGVCTMDADEPSDLAAFARGRSPVPADRGFLLEGLSPDTVGAGLSCLDMPEIGVHLNVVAALHRPLDDFRPPLIPSMGSFLSLEAAAPAGDAFASA